MTWKFIALRQWLAGTLLVVLALAFVKICVAEISLLTHWEYSIAQVTKVYRGAKGERHIRYWYDVEGVRYERASVWDGKVQPGKRYVVRYATFDPAGNQFQYDLPVPDSIAKPHGRSWQAFLRAAHYHPPYIRYHAVMDQPSPSFQ
jgi:hypothetical protein